MQPIKTAYSILFWQLILVIGLALLMVFLKGIQSGVSSLLGSLAYWVPTLFFVWRVFAKTTARVAHQFLMKFIMGEMGKLLLSGLFFLLIIKYLPVHIVSVLTGFVGAVVLFWVASFFLFTRHERVG